MVADVSALPLATPLGAFLSALGPGAEPSAAGTIETCPACGATLADIRASGRLGCATCWSVFDRHLRDLLRRLHGATRHAGAWYDDPAGADDDPARVAHLRIRLREALREAVESEEFETAASLRDQLRALEER